MNETMKIDVRGTEAKGRPRMRWMENIRHDMNKCVIAGGCRSRQEKKEKVGGEPDLEQYWMREKEKSRYSHHRNVVRDVLR